MERLGLTLASPPLLWGKETNCCHSIVAAPAVSPKSCWWLFEIKQILFSSYNALPLVVHNSIAQETCAATSHGSPLQVRYSAESQELISSAMQYVLFLGNLLLLSNIVQENCLRLGVGVSHELEQ